MNMSLLFFMTMEASFSVSPFDKVDSLEISDLGDTVMCLIWSCHPHAESVFRVVDWTFLNNYLYSSWLALMKLDPKLLRLSSMMTNESSTGLSALSGNIELTGSWLSVTSRISYKESISTVSLPSAFFSYGSALSLPYDDSDLTWSMIDFSLEDKTTFSLDLTWLRLGESRSLRMLMVDRQDSSFSSVDRVSSPFVRHEALCLEMTRSWARCLTFCNDDLIE